VGPQPKYSYHLMITTTYPAIENINHKLTG